MKGGEFRMRIYVGVKEKKSNVKYIDVYLLI